MGGGTTTMKAGCGGGTSGFLILIINTSDLLSQSVYDVGFFLVTMLFDRTYYLYHVGFCVCGNFIIINYKSSLQNYRGFSAFVPIS